MHRVRKSYGELGNRRRNLAATTNDHPGTEKQSFNGAVKLLGSISGTVGSIVRVPYGSTSNRLSELPFLVAWG